MFTCHLSFFLYSGCHVTSLPSIYITPFKIPSLLHSHEAAEDDIVIIT